MFPKIQVLSDLLPHIQDNPQIRVKPDEKTGHTIVCYMLQDEDTFFSGNQDYARECRGITFHPDGSIASRTMHKFFNVGENDETQLENLDWDSVLRVMDKRDGSMVTPVLKRFHVNPDGALTRIVKPQFYFKTKKTFSSPEAELANELARRDQGLTAWIHNLLVSGLTPTFEMTSPKFPIVLTYERDELTLLHIRENVSGQYLTEKEIQFLNPPVSVVKNVLEEFTDFFGGTGGPNPDGSSSTHFEKGFAPFKILNEAKTREKIEGWVIQFASGDMAKVKTKWYCDLHHAVTFVRFRDVARAVCEDRVDDLKGAFALVGRNTMPIDVIQSTIHTFIKDMKAAIEKTVENHKDLTVKDMALKFKGHDHFGLIMNKFRGKEIDYLEWYVAHDHLKDWSLEVIPL